MKAHCQKSPRSITTMLRPVSRLAVVLTGSLACFGNRNQSASIGAPRSSTVSLEHAAHGRMAAVASHGELGTDLDRTVRRVSAHAGHPAPLLGQLDCLRPHPQTERWIFPASFDEKVQEVPLRHQREKLGAGRQMTKVREGIFPAAETLDDDGFPLVRQLEELVQQAELEHDLHGGGMNGIARENRARNRRASRGRRRRRPRARAGSRA